MEQYKKIVLEAPKGMHYTTSQGSNGELILCLVTDCFANPENRDASYKSQIAERVAEEENYFTKISAERREEVKKWLDYQKGSTKREKGFLQNVSDAIQNVDYDYWIANIEPSVDKGKIYYAEDNDVGVKFSGNQWFKMAEEFMPERGSRLGTLYELFIWYAWRIVKGFWTLDYVANNSSGAGNYKNAPNACRKMEKTGKRACGGYKDGQGNTYKIVTHKSSLALVGGAWHNAGDAYPVADTNCYYGFDHIRSHASGVVVLTK